MSVRESIQHISTVDEYVDAFENGTPVTVTSLCGRMIRGKKPSDYDHLTDDTNRKIVMLIGPDGLEELLGKSGYDALNLLGYTKDHIAERVTAGYKFKLAVFEEGRDAHVADWDNMTALAAEIYPDIRNQLESHLDELKSTSFATIEEAAGFSFAEVDHIGIADPRYMTHERYLMSPQDLVSTRAFHYFTLHLRELYSGDGYTYDKNGKKGVLEYAIPNKPIHELGKHALIDIAVKLA